MCLYANFQFLWWLHDHFIDTIQQEPISAKSAWSQTLQTGKRHTFRVSAFHRYRWFGVKLFPIAVRRTVEGYLKREKCCIWIWLRPRYKIPEFFTIAPHPSSPPLLTICRRNRGDQSSLYRTQGALLVLQKNSHSGFACSRPRADLGLSRPTSFVQ